VEVLRRLRCTLLLSTYEAGQLVAIGADDERLRVNGHQFDQAAGVAAIGDTIAVGTRGQVWFLRNAPEIAPLIEPRDSYDRCYLRRSSSVTGSIRCHELAWGIGDDGAPSLWIVNTLFSCLAGLHANFNFVPRWRPPFISELAGQDHCHLSGLGMRDGRPAFVTAMARSDEPAGWRTDKNRTGCVLEVPSGEVISTGLATPHSPRWYGGDLLVLNSGWGTLETVDRDTGRRSTVAQLSGFSRGLACHGGLAFVGLSRIRDKHAHGGVPISDRQAAQTCGVAVVDLRCGETVAMLEFESGIEEIFDIQVLPDTAAVAFAGGEPGEPRPDGEVWVLPHEPPGGDESVDALLVRARAALRGGRPADAVASLVRATAARPDSAQIASELGDALQAAGQQPQAIEQYRRAVAADPTFTPALQNLGYLLVAQGATDEGVGYLRRAQEVAPSDLNRLLIATALPVVHSSTTDAAQRRHALERDVRALAEEGIRIDTERMLVPTNFFAAYEGVNDRELQANLGRIFAGPSLVAPAAGPPGAERNTQREAERRAGRPRIGFISAYFRDHTIGQLNLGRVQRLDRERFEVVVFSVGTHRDPVAAAFEEAADAYVRLPRDPAAARRLVTEQDLDLLLFTDVGIDALTYTLAFSRMAPVQCATWGHPVTTGSPAIDYFISSQLLEVAGAESHYTERLVQLPSLGTWYRRPAPPQVRIELELDDGAHIYACPQTLFKLHPTFDPLIAEILRRDPKGVLVLIEGRIPTWTRLVSERIQHAMPDVANRVRWLAPLPRERFLGLLRASAVLLDPITFGGGNTSYEGLAMGTPVVTWPNELMRTRITSALYSKADYIDLIASSADEYVELAVALGVDPDHRARVQERIRSTCDVLYEDDREVRDLEEFLAEAVGLSRLRV
jgi:protein O-GlcNAc transferase